MCAYLSAEGRQYRSMLFLKYMAAISRTTSSCREAHVHMNIGVSVCASCKQTPKKAHGSVPGDRQRVHYTQSRKCWRGANPTRLEIELPRMPSRLKYVEGMALKTTKVRRGRVNTYLYACSRHEDLLQRGVEAWLQLPGGKLC